MKRYNMAYLWAVCLVAALGGLLFGYDWVVIAGAKPFYEVYFHLTGSPGQQGWAMSCALVGCMIGAVCCGVLSDKFGRRRLLILAGALFVVSALGTAWAGSYAAFIVYRIVGGVGIGLASNLSPMYIAEISPAEMRGKFVSINQLTIVIGIAAAQVVNWLIARPVPEGADAAHLLASWNGQLGWRWMFAAETAPALLFFLAMFPAPESPRWLVKNGMDDRAKRILGRVGGASYAAREIARIRKTLVHQIGRVRFGDLLTPKMLWILSVGVTLAVFQQWCGINVIFSYAKDIFAAAGYGVSDILWNIVVTGAVNLVFTFVAVYTVDRLGRKSLMLAGSAALAMIFAAMGTCFFFKVQGVHVLALALAAIACYAFSLAPVTWVLLSEMFPNRIRGAAMSVSVFALWLSCFLLALMFPAIYGWIGIAACFWIFAGVCVAGLIYIWTLVPETKGKTLERIEAELVD